MNNHKNSKIAVGIVAILSAATTFFTSSCIIPVRVPSDSNSSSTSKGTTTSQANQEENLPSYDPQSILSISSAAPSEPNSAGGVDLYITWQNESDKTIKYIHFYVQPYNAVDDPVKCEIRRQSTMKCSSTGPYETGEGSSSDNRYWQNVWYNNTIKTVKITKIEIEYMDDTSITLEEEEIEQIYS